jgi:hypothetical protein
MMMMMTTKVEFGPYEMFDGKIVVVIGSIFAQLNQRQAFQKSTGGLRKSPRVAAGQKDKKHPMKWFFRHSSGFLKKAMIKNITKNEFDERQMLLVFRDVMKVSMENLQCVSYEVFKSTVSYEGKAVRMFTKI